MLSFKKAKTWVVAISVIAVSVFLVGFTSNRVMGNMPYSPVPFPTAVYQTTSEQMTDFMIERFEVYREFGLVYDPATDRLYFHGELVRYFEDMIPLPDSLGSIGETFGITHFTENGTVDVRAVRDFSVVVQLPNGATDHSGVIVGVEPFSQEEFDVRDIDVLITPPQLNALEMPVFPQDASDGFSANVPVPEFQPGQVPLMGVTEMPSNALVGSMTMAEMFADFEEFGVTFGGNLLNGGTGNIYYNGRLVRTLIDVTNGGVTSLLSSDSSGTINVRGIRDENGNLTDLDIVEI